MTPSWKRKSRLVHHRSSSLGGDPDPVPRVDGGRRTLFDVSWVHTTPVLTLRTHFPVSRDPRPVQDPVFQRVESRRSVERSFYVRTRERRHSSQRPSTDVHSGEGTRNRGLLPMSIPERRDSGVRVLPEDRGEGDLLDKVPGVVKVLRRT